MNVDFVVTNIEADRFTGGYLCLFRYANGLVERGHHVRVVPLGEIAERPRWFDLKAELVLDERPSVVASMARGGWAATRRRLRGSTGRPPGEAVGDLLRRVAPHGPPLYQRANAIDRFRRLAGNADVTVATAFQTAVPVCLYGSGAHAYFTQHYEPVKMADHPDRRLAAGEAWLSYELPLTPIANSTWLAKTIRERHGRDARTCLNAINHDDFFPDGEPPPQPFTVVSYGGRQVRWKGFAEAAEAVRLARQQIPDLRWLVFGGALLPPDNDVAHYEDVGFVVGQELRQLYSAAHATLCTSWYESFPLFPIEAMACGSAVITTPLGTEDFARDRETAMVVPARDPAGMAARLVELAHNTDLRQAIAKRGREEAKRHTWDRSIGTLERILDDLVSRTRDVTDHSAVPTVDVP